MNQKLITEQSILLDFEADSKDEALYGICAQLFLLRKTSNPSGLYKDIIQRENVVSTFAGQHTAIPHVITQHINEPVLCFVRMQNPDFCWNSADEDVRIIFLLAVPPKENLQKLRESQSYVFSSIAQLMNDPKMIECWLTTSEERVILDSLQLAFQSNLDN
jgi:PTS system fructose-specific IIA component